MDHNRLILEADAFLFDPSFPNATYWKKLLRPGTPVGRLFYAPESAKLTTNEIWEAVKDNRLKLPNTISIDRLGRVFLTPHKVRYTLKSPAAAPGIRTPRSTATPAAATSTRCRSATTSACSRCRPAPAC